MSDWIFSMLVIPFSLQYYWYFLISSSNKIVGIILLFSPNKSISSWLLTETSYSIYASPIFSRFSLYIGFLTSIGILFAFLAILISLSCDSIC